MGAWRARRTLGSPQRPNVRRVRSSRRSRRWRCASTAWCPRGSSARSGSARARSSTAPGQDGCIDCIAGSTRSAIAPSGTRRGGWRRCSRRRRRRPEPPLRGRPLAHARGGAGEHRRHHAAPSPVQRAPAGTRGRAGRRRGHARARHPRDHARPDAPRPCDRGRPRAVERRVRPGGVPPTGQRDVRRNAARPVPRAAGNAAAAARPRGPSPQRRDRHPQPARAPPPRPRREARPPAPADQPGRPRGRARRRWPEQRLVVECDGFAAHGTRRAFEHDRARDRALQVAGWRVVRITWRQLTDDADVIARQLAALLARPPSPGPSKDERR